MLLKDFSLNTASRRVDLLPSGGTVIASDTLREAALRASWQRDHHVGRRRQAWRWTLFWIWKFGCFAGVAIGPIALVVALILQFELIPRYDTWVATPTVTSHPVPPQTIARTGAAPGANSTGALDLKQAMTLTNRASSLAALSAQAIARASPSVDTQSAALSETATQSVQLKPDYQLFLKESSP